MDERYLTPQKGGRWAVSLRIGDKHVSLVENCALDDALDAELILLTLDIQPTDENLNRYFPVLCMRVGRSPNLEVIELCCLLDPTNPLRDAIQKKRASAAV